jgi:hypothetical protein
VAGVSIKVLIKEPGKSFKIVLIKSPILEIVLVIVLVELVLILLLVLV